MRWTGLLVTALMLLVVTSAPGAEDATEIVKRANDVLNQEAAFARMKMTIVTTSGDTRELFFDSWMKDRGAKTLIRYTAPSRVRGQAMLLLNNATDIWSYFPRTKRVRKLASHAKKQKMQGSDFSYEDMGSGDSFVTDFEHRLLGEESVDGHACYKIELRKKEGTDSSYSRILTWVEKERFVIWRLDYYDEDDPDVVAKRLTVSDVKVVDGVPTPMVMVMHNLLDGTETSQEFLEVSYNVELEDAMFTERGLQQ
jgi:outer membrane lipoprotein-sorting protein